MADTSGIRGVYSDASEALKLVFRLTWHRNLVAWVYVPTGGLMILLACFGVNSLLGFSSVSFPASVAVLLVLFFTLILLDFILGDRKVRLLVNVIDVPAGWALRYISLFFTPSFVLLPLSPRVTGIEVAIIIATFLIGFVVMLAVTAWIVRGLQLLLGSSKRAMTERAEELGNENDNIPLTDSTGRQDSQVVLDSVVTMSGHGEVSTTDLVAPPRAQDPTKVRGTGGPPESDITLSNTIRQTPLSQAPLPLTRPQRWAAFINMYFDQLTYLILFVFVGVPIYYGTGYAMPAQLTFNVLTYFAALALPARWRQFLHPVLVSAAITILGIWVLGLIHGDALNDVLEVYKTGTTYQALWHGEKASPFPGAGDIFSSALDASIVALALPMFQYRHELRRHFFAIVIPNVTISIASLFGYPALCYAIGISSERSLAFAARSLTLALAIPAINNMGGDVNTGAALAIMSGILGVLIGPRILAWLKIPEDDYVTRGVTLGGNSSAIATALLLLSDPRAAALSSLSMSLFGIITLTLTSMPPIVRIVQSFVDL